MGALVLTTYIEQLEMEMRKNADPQIALQMSAYLKNKFVCFGIKSPVRNAIQKEWFAAIKSSQFPPFDVVAQLWVLDQREYQYIALDYLNKQPKKTIGKEDWKILEELIVTKSWWETVDTLASNYIGFYFTKFPEQKETVIERWRHADNMWLNRTCLIFQLKYKTDVDFELLKDLIRQYQDVPEFFIQKAIGWSLRQYSKYHPEAVKAFVEEIGLKGLAKREASKYL